MIISGGPKALQSDTDCPSMGSMDDATTQRGGEEDLSLERHLWRHSLGEEAAEVILFWTNW